MAARKKAKKKQQQAPRRRVGTPVLTQSSKPARPLFRLLPMTVTAASLLLTLKMVEIYQNGRDISDAFFAEPVLAQQEAPKEDAPKAEEKADEESEAKEEAPAEDAHGEGGEAKKPELPPGASTEAPAPTPAGQGMDVPVEQGYNKRELGVLENLSARREKIEQLEREVALREKMLQATEQNIDTKLNELKSLSEEVKGMLVVQNKEEETKITSLVKIYEAMKPKDAARIFDEMDMDVLLMVAGRMSERKVAPVLAAMTPEKAKDVTQELAAQQKRNRATIEATQEKVSAPPL
ncbi:MAG: hypothetical protein FJX23_06955 [Alphaproteobacteria bacterium]|nr:hypothetical protein [Alphaproteobacteria bacterium]